MEQIVNYIKPELLIVSVVLYFIGIGLKKSERFSDKYIPEALGVIGILLVGLYVTATCPLGNLKEISLAVFTAIVQGTLVAGLSTYINQIFKQLNKEE